MMESLCRDQIEKEILFYQRYLLAIGFQIDKRNALRDSYLKLVSSRDTNTFWSYENERNLGDMKKQIRKITKKQLRDFYIIAKEISEAVIRAVKMIAM